MQTAEEPIVIAKIGAPHGIRGGVRVYPVAEFKEQLPELKSWLIHKQGVDAARAVWQPVEVCKLQWHGKSWVASLKNIVDRDQAASLTLASVAVLKQHLPVLGEGRYYKSELINFHVRNLEGVLLGTVQEIFETGANDVMVVVGDKQHLIPYVFDHYIQKVELAENQIIVDWDPEF